MRVLKFCEEVLSVLDLFSYEVFEKATNKYLKYLNPYILLISQCGYFFTSAGFILSSSGDLSDWMMALVQTISAAAITGAFLCIALQMKNTERLHVQLQDVVDDAKETKSFEIYKKCEWKCQTWTKWPLILVYAAPMTISVIPPLIHSSLRMWQGNFDTSTWFSIYRMAMPFDTSSIFGWYGLVLAGILMGPTPVFTITAIITYFMSCSFYVDACCQHLLFLYFQIEEKINENPRKSFENISEIKRKLGKAVSLHVKIIKVFNLVAEIMGGVIFAFLVSCFVCLAIFLYFFDQNLNQMNYKLFSVQFYAITFFLGFPYILCYFASNLSQNLLSIADVAYNEISWYQLPPNLEKYILLIIQRAQEPVYITGFKLVYCTLYNFAMYIRSTLSAYAVIREMATQ